MGLFIILFPYINGTGSNIEEIYGIQSTSSQISSSSYSDGEEYLFSQHVKGFCKLVILINKAVDEGID